ncbi:hypothetical protein MHYP_G00021110 [Metynnis hypsauchen]
MLEDDKEKLQMARDDQDSKVNKVGLMISTMKSKVVHEHHRLHLFTSIVMPTVTYASETWKASPNINNKPCTTIRCLCPVLKFQYYNHISTKRHSEGVVSGKRYLHVIAP